MSEILPDRLPWFIAAPVIGACVTALYALANQRIGVTSSYTELGSLVRGRAPGQSWRIWFFVGLAGGAALAGLLRGGRSMGLGYGALGVVLPIAVLIPVLFAGGVLIGFGARWAGGCTSGHGISGVSSLSVTSLVAGCALVAAAGAVTLARHGVTGGAL